MLLCSLLGNYNYPQPPCWNLVHILEPTGRQEVESKQIFLKLWFGSWVLAKTQSQGHTLEHMWICAQPSPRPRRNLDVAEKDVGSLVFYQTPGLSVTFTGCGFSVMMTVFLVHSACNAPHGPPLYPPTILLQRTFLVLKGELQGLFNGPVAPVSPQLAMCFLRHCVTVEGRLIVSSLCWGWVLQNKSLVFFVNAFLAPS